MEFVTKDTVKTNEETGETVRTHTIEGIRVTNCCGCILITLGILVGLRIITAFI